MIPEPGSKEWEGMVDFMRADLDSGMQLTKIEMIARKFIKEDGRDFDEEFEKWKNEQEKSTYLMKVKCAWCGANMGIKPCNEDQQDMISHGICESCKIKLEEEVMTMPRGDGQGPPKGSQGPKDGHGGGSGNQSGQGSGPKTGGGKGNC